MTTSRTEYNRKWRAKNIEHLREYWKDYRDRNREERNAYLRNYRAERKNIMPNQLYIPSAITPADANNNREAFERAMVEFVDDEMRERIEWMIYRTADVLVRERKMGKETAIKQATEFIGACIWNKATARGGRGRSEKG